jgi:mRNA interferase RelE/StbE
MASYKIAFKTSAEKDLRRLPKPAITSILTAIDALAINPYPTDIKKLKGLERPYFRLRVGNYRVIYEVHNQELVVHIIEIGHRKEIYRNY